VRGDKKIITGKKAGCQCRLRPRNLSGHKGIDGLAGVVRAVLGRDPASGDLFVFKNRRGDTLKILAWMGDGFALELRRLDKGTFAFPGADARELAITPTQLALILGGVELDRSCPGVMSSEQSLRHGPSRLPRSASRFIREMIHRRGET